MESFNTDEDGFHACLTALAEKDGAVLLVPTETVYGLVCDYESEQGREKIYELKKRPKNKMLTAFFPDVASVKKMIEKIPEAALSAAEKFCPGPITIVVPDGENQTFGFRIPEHDFLLSLLNAYGKPLASTSANLSGSPQTLSTQAALCSLSGEPDVVIDGGIIDENSKASTVVQFFRDGSWKILRNGPISENMLKDVLK